MAYTTKIYFSQFCRLEVSHQGVNRFAFPWGLLSPWLADGTFLSYPRTAFSLFKCIPVIFPSYKNISHIGLGQGPLIWPNLTLIIYLKALSQKTVRIGGVLGIRALIHKFEGDTFRFITEFMLLWSLFFSPSPCLF